MSDFQVINKDNFFISVIPFAFKGICFVTEKLLLSFFDENHHFTERIKGFHHNLSSSYLAFLGIMITASLIIARIRAGNKDERVNPNPQSRKIKERIMYLCKLMILYTVIFGSFQVVSGGLLDKSSAKDLNLSQSLLTFRNLDQYDIEEEMENGVERLNPSSSINSGELVGSFPLQGRITNNPSLALSKDGETLFVLTHEYDSESQMLTIFDISDPQKQRELKSIDLAPYLNFRLLGADLLLSPDEQSLFVLSCNGLIILDVSNPSSPSTLFVDDFLANWNSKEDQSSLAISSDGKTLYAVTQKDLKIYDVSQVKFPSLLYNKTSNFTGSMDISKDDQRIVIASATKFDIFNVSDPRNPLLISSVNIHGRIISIVFSDNEKKILLGLKLEFYHSMYRLDYVEFEMRGLDDLRLSLMQSISVDGQWGNYGLWFHENKNYAYFATRTEIKMMNLADNQRATLFQTDSEILNHASIRYWKNNRTVLVFSEKVCIIRLNIDIAPKSLVNFKPNALKVLDQKDYDRKFVIALSQDEKSLFLVRTIEALGELVSYEIMDNFSLKKGNSFSFDNANRENKLVDANWNLDVRRNLTVLSYKSSFSAQSDIHLINFSYPSLLWSWSQGKRGLFKIGETVLADNEKTFIFLGSESPTGKSRVLSIMTFENQDLNLSLEKFEISSCDCSNLDPRMKISNDGRIVFYVDCNLLIYNISDLTMPVLESSLILNSTKVFAMTLSKDENVLYLFRLTSKGERKLEIVDISEAKAPKILSSILISPSSESIESMELSLDERVLFIGFADGVLTIDVRVPTNPKLFGYNYFANKKHALKLAKTKSLFYSASENGVSVYNMTFQYILHLEKSAYEIGELSEINLFVLKLNKNLKFDFLAKEHKFQKVSLFEGQSFKALPNWITFDKEKSSLRIEPNSASTRGSYKIAVTLSTQIQGEAFFGLESISNTTASKELMLDLIQSGYLDSFGYISENFDLNQELWINAKYKNIEKNIRVILSQNFIQVIGEISVVPSLSLSEAKPLKISSRSKGTISVVIKLDRSQGSPQFLTKSYPYVKSSTINEKSELTLEGSLENINEALKQVIVDLQGLEVCDGRINITDGINPPIFRSIRLISNYFNENRKPMYNNLAWSLEKQIANQSGFYTGLYSVIDLNPNTFTDENNLTLEYFLEMQDSKKVPPSWISVKGLSLVGIPPESYSLSYDLILVAKNEFQNITVPFTLDIHISFYYGVRLVITFVGYLFTLLGLILTVNKIYNIIARKYYRYPRSFKLRNGDEINDSKIFPISFVKAEISESQKIFKQLQKDVTQALDEEKIIEIIENEYLNREAGGKSFSHKVVKQLVINKFIMKQLDSKQEIETKKLFNKIKDQWMDLVLATATPAQFQINSEKLAEILPEPDQNETNLSILSESSLLEKKKYNQDLLENAIIAHAFSFQNLDIDTIKVEVVSHRKLIGNSLWIMVKRFLLRDLEAFNFLNKREIGYGIEYKIKNNTLHFAGKLTHDLGDHIIVVHLKNERGRILRELCVTGTEENELAVSKVSDISEIL